MGAVESVHAERFHWYFEFVVVWTQGTAFYVDDVFVSHLEESGEDGEAVLGLLTKDEWLVLRWRRMKRNDFRNMVLNGTCNDEVMRFLINGWCLMVIVIVGAGGWE